MFHRVLPSCFWSKSVIVQCADFSTSPANASSLLRADQSHAVFFEQRLDMLVYYPCLLGRLMRGDNDQMLLLAIDRVSPDQVAIHGQRRRLRLRALLAEKTCGLTRFTTPFRYA